MLPRQPPYVNRFVRKGERFVISLRHVCAGPYRLGQTAQVLKISPVFRYHVVRIRANKQPLNARLVLRLVGLLTFTMVLLTAFRAGWTRAETDFPNYYTAAVLVRHGQPLRKFYDWTWFARQMNYAGIERAIGAYTPQTPLTMLPIVPLPSLPVQRAKQIWLLCDLAFLGITISRDSGQSRFGPWLSRDISRCTRTSCAVSTTSFCCFSSQPPFIFFSNDVHSPVDSLPDVHSRSSCTVHLFCCSSWQSVNGRLLRG